MKKILNKLLMVTIYVSSGLIMFLLFPNLSIFLFIIYSSYGVFISIKSFVVEAIESINEEKNKKIVTFPESRTNVDNISNNIKKVNVNENNIIYFNESCKAKTRVRK